ncbi:unnamed protein product [Lactuca saligna]|uniref:Uncharacterized protein n=1 Tax=Lactuca saligna TaxID=75948 RepID=A0AA35Y9A9_LACSI|nr:unnamed protein product [Lactuca saligna]
MIRKPHVTQKGVVLREILVPVSTSSKKRRVEDVANHISKKTKKRKSILQEDEEDKVVLDSPIGNVSSSSVKTSTVNTSTLHVNSTKILTPTQTSVIPPEVSLTKPFTGEFRTSDILTHVSNTDVNVNICEGFSNKENPVSTQGAMKKVVEWYQSLLPKFDEKAANDIGSFGKPDTMLSEHKERVLKSG